ncbi:hypothetical protein [Paraburkholderia sp. J12]|uniref:hypothetical protein n=1 Tax=Paraburkholderia sp. J12 TaxID=2805432 RepID=UPI002ABDF0A6|nr:hypothetical protein [Paraburkholderia sp. J12]
MKTFALAAATAFALSAGTAAHAVEVYGGVGTDGITGGLGFSIEPHDNIRAEFSGFSLSHGFNSDGLHYDGTYKITHGGLFVDFFPAPNVVGLRVTAGMLIGDDNLSGDATPMNGTYTFNGVTVPAGGETVHAKASYPTVRPYLGVGFGHNPLKRGFSVTFDAGVTYGKPHVDFDVPADLVALAGQQNVNAEEQSLQNKANDLKFYPIVRLGVTYRF